MNKFFSFLLITSFSGAALAGADCQKHPENEWLSVFDVQKKIINEYGFAIKMFKVDGNCYEIYGWRLNEAGKQQKVEVYFDTNTAEIVKQKID